MENILTGLTGTQRALLRYYLDVVGSRGSVLCVFRMHFQDTFGQGRPSDSELKVAKIEITLDGGSRLYLYATLGDSNVDADLARDHEHQFVGVYDVDDMALAHLVAYARAHHLFAAEIDAEHSFVLAEDDLLRQRGYAAALVTEIDIYPPFGGKREVELSGLANRLLGVLPLSEHEREIKVSEGVAGLFAHFGSVQRDLLAVASLQSE